jgi:hypothetical protein
MSAAGVIWRSLSDVQGKPLVIVINCRYDPQAVAVYSGGFKLDNKRTISQDDQKAVQQGRSE